MLTSGGPTEGASSVQYVNSYLKVEPSSSTEDDARSVAGSLTGGAGQGPPGRIAGRKKKKGNKPFFQRSSHHLYNTIVNIFSCEP